MSAGLAIMGLQAGMGLFQMARGEKIRREVEKNRPTYEVAQEATEGVQIARNLAASVMPGYDQALEELNVSQANAMAGAKEAATSPAQVMEAAIKSQINKDRQTRALTAENARFKAGQAGTLINSLRYLASEKEKAFNINELMPWQANMNAANQFQGAGINNLFQAASNSAAIATSNKRHNETMAMLQDIINGEG